MSSGIVGSVGSPDRKNPQLCPRNLSIKPRLTVSSCMRPHGLQPTRFLHSWDSPGKNTGVGCHFLFSGDLPNPGIKSRSPTFQADSTI